MDPTCTVLRPLWLIVWLIDWEQTIKSNLKPSCLQTTTHAASVKKSSQTVPHVLLYSTSSRPDVCALPAFSRTWTDRPLDAAANARPNSTASVADPEIFIGGRGKTMHQPRRHLAQMHTYEKRRPIEQKILSPHRTPLWIRYCTASTSQPCRTVTCMSSTLIYYAIFHLKCPHCTAIDRVRCDDYIYSKRLGHYTTFNSVLIHKSSVSADEEPDLYRSHSNFWF